MQTLSQIDFTDMLYMFVPVSVVGYLYFRWCGDRITVFYALLRMTSQLILIGYMLVYIFRSDASLIVVGILTVMLVIASTIAVRTLKQKRFRDYIHAIVALFVSLTIHLTLITQMVLKITPWYNPMYTIPLAGMIYAVSMNAIALASERFFSEREQHTFEAARSVAFKTALIPVINSLFAVGLVSLPGLMTGQILSGVDPLIAVRYQIVVMLMLFGSAGTAAATYLWMVAKSESKISK